MKLKRGDKVKVISGDERGQSGKVLQVDWEKSRVIVERVNMVKRHQKPRGQGVQSGIIEKEAPIHISNVKKIED